MSDHITIPKDQILSMKAWHQLQIQELDKLLNKTTVAKKKTYSKSAEKVKHNILKKITKQTRAA